VGSLAASLSIVLVCAGNLPSLYTEPPERLLGIARQRAIARLHGFAKRSGGRAITLPDRAALVQVCWRGISRTYTPHRGARFPRMPHPPPALGCAPCQLAPSSGTSCASCYAPITMANGGRHAAAGAGCRDAAAVAWFNPPSVYQPVTPC